MQNVNDGCLGTLRRELFRSIIEKMQGKQMEQAVDAAKTYIEVMSLSMDMLMEVMTSDYGAKFTKEQAEFAANKLGL